MKFVENKTISNRIESRRYLKYREWVVMVVHLNSSRSLASIGDTRLNSFTRIYRLRAIHSHWHAINSKANQRRSCGHHTISEIQFIPLISMCETFPEHCSDCVIVWAGIFTLSFMWLNAKMIALLAHLIASAVCRLDLVGNANNRTTHFHRIIIIIDDDDDDNHNEREKLFLRHFRLLKRIKRPIHCHPNTCRRIISPLAKYILVLVLPHSMP